MEEFGISLHGNFQRFSHIWACGDTAILKDMMKEIVHKTRIVSPDGACDLLFVCVPAKNHYAYRKLASPLALSMAL